MLVHTHAFHLNTWMTHDYITGACYSQFVKKILINFVMVCICVYSCFQWHWKLLENHRITEWWKRPPRSSSPTIIL